MEAGKSQRVLDYEKELSENTEKMLGELYMTNPSLMQKCVKYQNCRRVAEKRGAVSEIIIRGLLLTVILGVASFVFQLNKLPQDVYDYMNSILLGTVPQMISKAAILFSSPAALVGLCLFDVLLLVLFFWNESRFRFLKSYPWLRSLYRGVLLPLMIVVLFAITFGAFIFVDAMSNPLDTKPSEDELIQMNADKVAQGIARFCKLPLIGDVISSASLVAIIPSERFGLFSSVPCGKVICSACTLFVFAATFSCFLSVIQMVLNKFSLRNVLYVIVVSVACLLGSTISEYYPQFTFGFVIVIIFHMICFLEAVFVVFSVSPDEKTFANDQESRWSSFSESEMEVLGGITDVLRSSDDIVLYVGEDLVKESLDGKISLSDLSIFNNRTMWNLLPSLAVKKFRNVLLTPIASVDGLFEGEVDLCKLLGAIAGSKNCRITVITECVDGKLQLPPSMNLIELRGNVTQMKCPNGHRKIVSAQDQFDPNKIRCDDCGCTLMPSICLGSEFDAVAVHAACGIIQALHVPTGAILVIGKCCCPEIVRTIQSTHDSQTVPLVQISRRLNFKNANFHFCASTRGTLGQIWEMEDDEYPLESDDENQG